MRDATPRPFRQRLASFRNGHSARSSSPPAGQGTSQVTELLVWLSPLVLGALFAGAAAIVGAPVLRMHRSWSRTMATVVDVEQFVSGGEMVRRVELRFRGTADREWTATCP